MGDRYTTAGYIISGTAALIALAATITIILNQGEPWTQDLGLAVAALTLAAVTITIALVIASIHTEHRRLR